MYTKIIKRLFSEYNRTSFEINANDILCDDMNEEKASKFGNSLYVPVSIFQLTNGFTAISAMKKYKEPVETFVKNHLDYLFSHDSINKLCELLSNNINSDNCKLDSRSYRYALTYGCKDIYQLPKEKILSSTIQYEYGTTYIVLPDGYQNPHKSNQWSNYKYFGTLIDDKIVSACSHNMLLIDAVDIGIGTAEEYRRRGFAVSNVISMAEYLNNQGKEVYYSCHNENIASQHVAISSGFEEVAKCYDLWLTKL